MFVPDAPRGCSPSKHVRCRANFKDKDLIQFCSRPFFQHDLYLLCICTDLSLSAMFVPLFFFLYHKIMFHTVPVCAFMLAYSSHLHHFTICFRIGLLILFSKKYNVAKPSTNSNVLCSLFRCQRRQLDRPTVASV